MIFQKTFQNILMLVTVTIPTISLSPKNALADVPIKVSNQSEAQVLYLYISESQSKIQSSDFLEKEVLNNNQEQSFSLSDSSCIYDIRAVLNNGNDVYGEDIDLCRNPNIIINSSSIQGQN